MRDTGERREERGEAGAARPREKNGGAESGGRLSARALLSPLSSLPPFRQDLQVHSFESHDGLATIREHCLRAVELGVDELGFSEHKDFDPADPVVGHFDYARYSDAIAAAREEFGGQLTIRMGVEVDYRHWFEGWIGEYLAEHPFDYVISSVHYVDGATIMTPEYLAGKTREQAYRLYYDEVMRSVEGGFLDILGHLEYANRRGVPAFGPFDPTPYRAQLIDLFDMMIEKGVALEINTAGLRQGAGVTYPCAEHVLLYAERGGRLLTVGSDAHHPRDLSSDYQAAVEIAAAAGIGGWGRVKERGERREESPGG